MKSIYLLFFSFAQLVFFSCSEQGIYINNVSNQVIQKDIAITRAISNLTPNCSLLIEIDENAQDTVLERLKLNIAREWYSHRKGLSLPLIDSTIKFVPVIDTPSLPSITDSDRIKKGRLCTSMLYIQTGVILQKKLILGCIETRLNCSGKNMLIG